MEPQHKRPAPSGENVPDPIDEHLVTIHQQIVDTERAEAPLGDEVEHPSPVTGYRQWSEVK